MLRYFLRKAQPPGLRFKPRVLVTVPGCATPVEKRAVFNSVLRAGARQVFLVQEALAAALGAGMPVAEPTGLPVRCPTILPTETRRRVNCERERWASPAATRDSSPFIVHHSSIRNPQSPCLPSTGTSSAAIGNAIESVCAGAFVLSRPPHFVGRRIGLRGPSVRHGKANRAHRGGQLASDLLPITYVASFPSCEVVRPRQNRYTKAFEMPPRRRPARWRRPGVLGLRDALEARPTCRKDCRCLPILIFLRTSRRTVRTSLPVALPKARRPEKTPASRRPAETPVSLRPKEAPGLCHPAGALLLLRAGGTPMAADWSSCPSKTSSAAAT